MALHPHLSRSYFSSFVPLAALVAAATWSSAAVGQTTTFTMTANANGGLIRSNGVTETGGVTRLIGSSSNANQGLSNIYFFALPTIGPNQVITDATMNFNFDSISNSPTYNTDLYGLGYVDSGPNMSGSWFAEGPAPDTRTRASLGTGTTGTVSLIEDDILTTSTPLVAVSTSNPAAMIDFIDSLYADGAEGGDFAIFHYIADQFVSGPTGASGFRISHSDAPTSQLAQLEITVQQVPEPGTLAIWGLVAGVALLFAWRKGVRHSGRAMHPCRW